MQTFERPQKTERYQPPASLLVQEPIADWPATLTNGELLELARTWRAQALQCNADKAAIGRDATGQVDQPQPSDPVDAPAGRPWWKFW